MRSMDSDNRERDRERMPGSDPGRGREPGDRRSRDPLSGGSFFGNQGPRRILIALAVSFVILMIILPWIQSSIGVGSAEISYTEFLRRVSAGQVSSIVVEGQKIIGYDTSVSGEDRTPFVTYFPPFGDRELLNTLKDRGINVRVRPQNGFSLLTILLNGLPFLLLIYLFYRSSKLMRDQGKGVFGVGQNKAKLFSKTSESTTFKDVAGSVRAKGELEEIIAFLKNPSKFREFGAESPKGVLMVGPPGTGKTLLARAAAGEADVPFYSISGSDFMEMFVGVGASRVRNLFLDARKNSPSIIFIDELDSIGRHRGAGLGGGHDEREQTLNQLLSELDGFDSSKSVIVMAATNRPDILDPALLRPGRFDRRVTVDLPVLQERTEILKIHARGKPVDGGIDFVEIARGTPGFSGADLKNLLNESALVAARKATAAENGSEARNEGSNEGSSDIDSSDRSGAAEKTRNRNSSSGIDPGRTPTDLGNEHASKAKISKADVDEARDKIIMGLRRDGVSLTDRERDLLAYHESGHALLAAVLPNTDPLYKVSVIPRSGSLGVTMQLPERDKFLFEREFLFDRLAVLLGGRAAEEIAMDTATSGAENDMEEATKLARQMVERWGMSDRFGPITYGRARGNIFLGEELARGREYSEKIAADIDHEIGIILESAYDRARKAINERKEQFDRLAAELRDTEELSGARVLDILGLSEEEAKGHDSDTPENDG